MNRSPRTCSAALIALTVAGCASAPVLDGSGGVPSVAIRADRSEAVRRDSAEDAQRRMQQVMAREQAVQRLVSQGQAALAAGQLEAARAAFDEALALEPLHARALDGVAAVRSERQGREPASAPALRPLLQAPVSLEFREAPLKMVMEALARSVGLNVILDRDIPPQLRVSIFVRNVRVEDALDLLIHNHQLERKVLSENTILVYPATPQKLAEYRDLVLRTFQLSNADPKQVATLLRTMLKTRDLHVDDRSNLIVMRDTPDTVKAAERLIATLDRIDPEVVLELEILEVSASRMRDLGITHPTSFSGPVGTLAEIRRLDSGTVKADSGYGLRLLRTDGETRTLANPRVRVRNREKARVHVGDRVPVISSTIVGTASGTGGTSTPVTAEQIQYLDVGIKIEAEPTIHGDDTVAIRINLDVSSLGAQIRTNAGTTAYEVGTRNASTVLRLRDGETQALMGLIRDEDLQSGAGLPYIGELPVLDRLFGTKRTDRRSRELILLITPRLVRGTPRVDPASTEFWSGTESAIRLRDPLVQSLPEAARGARAPGGPGAAPAAAEVATPVPAATAAAASAGTGPLVLSWRAPPAAPAGSEITIELFARSDAAVRSASLQLTYDPLALEVLAVENGGFFERVGGSAVFTPHMDQEAGTISVTLGASGDGFASGAGSLLRLRARMRAGTDGTVVQLRSAVGVDPRLERLSVEGAGALSLRGGR